MTKPNDYFAADFLSHYTAHKLQNGGEPVITARELNYAANNFIHSIYCGKTTAIDHLQFDDLSAVVATWQNYAKQLDPDAKAGFRVVGDALLPTYDFHHLGGKTAKVLTTYFNHAPLLCMAPTATTTHQPVTKLTHLAATAAADYVTDYLAKAYIESNCKTGHWPCHLTDLYNLYHEDLARHLHLPGDKKYFQNFRQTATEYLAQLVTTAPDGVVRMTDQVGGTLAYNNFRRLTKQFTLLDELSTPNPKQPVPLQFRLLMRPDAIRVTERRLRSGSSYQAHRIDLTPAKITIAHYPTKLRKLTLGEKIHVLRTAIKMFTPPREK